MLTNQGYEQLQGYIQLEKDRVEMLGNEGIQYWQSVITNYYNLTREEAIEKLIKTEKIDQKIQTIQTAIQKAQSQ